jgi:GNAT superfamily N-acetyltransferase
VNVSDAGSDVWSVRAATPQDIEALCALLSACIAEMSSNGIDQWDDVYPTQATILADLVAGTISVAELTAPEVVASVVLNEYQNPEYDGIPWTITGGPVAVVHRLMVHPAQQRRGLAMFLMRFVEARARALGYAAIRLDAFLKNPRALRLYEGLGYRRAGTVMFRKGPFACFEKALTQSG